VTEAEGFPPGALCEDRLLGGRLVLLQPRTGFRAGSDAVLLAAAVPAWPGESALDLGCGAFAAGLCLAVRVPGVVLAGMELQPPYAALARANAARNAIPAEVVEGDLARPPAALAQRGFDHVLTNPPFFPRAATPAPDPGRDRARREAAPLALWLDAALRRLRPGGRLTLIQRAERLPEVLAALAGRAGAITVLPLAARAGGPAGRFILWARKGARGPFGLAAPFVLHAGAAHVSGADGYSPAAEAVLRGAAALTSQGAEGMPQPASGR
jgi:tRNA1(Val) A37 N6-methylase TrmN6